MALSEGEQRRLDEIARGLATEDPVFAATITANRFRRPRVVVAAIVFLVGMVALVTGLVVTDSALWFGVVILVTGLLAMGSAIVVYLRARRHG